jgi:hypothetical protein
MASASDSDAEAEDDDGTVPEFDPNTDEFTQRMLFSSSQHQHHPPAVAAVVAQPVVMPMPYMIPMAGAIPIPAPANAYLPPPHQPYYRPHMQYYDEHKNDAIPGPPSASAATAAQDSPIKFTFGVDYDYESDPTTSHHPTAASSSNNFAINMNPFPRDFPLSMSPPTSMNSALTPLVSSVQFGDFSPMTIILPPSSASNLSSQGIKPIAFQQLSPAHDTPVNNSPIELSSRISEVDLHSQELNGQAQFSPQRSLRSNDNANVMQQVHQQIIGPGAGTEGRPGQPHGPRRVLETSPSKRSKSDC